MKADIWIRRRKAMDTPMEIAREDYYNRYGYYPEDLKKQHPCYNCTEFDYCDGTEVWSRCENYKESEE